MQTISTKKISMHALLLAYDLHTRLFENVIEGITDKDAQNRLNTQANHIAWIAGSIVHERFELASALGFQLVQTGDELFENQAGILDNVHYPTLQQYKHDWQRITPVLRDGLIHISISELESREHYQMPGEDLTFFDAMAFIIDREAYCIGQIGLYRRLLGYEPMKYE